MTSELIKKINSKKDNEKSKILQKFFKTGKGEYGEGDIFLGIPMPEQRKLAKEYKNLENKELSKLLNSKIHDHRSIALIIMTLKYPIQKKEIFELYLKNTKNINNWDLVDISASKIIGNFLLDKDKQILHKLSNSKDLWEKRISIVSTLELIKNNHLETTIQISKKLLEDKHDLIHKAVGWMLRELGKKDKQLLEKFLRENYNKIPRTTLRYSIEKFPESERKNYLAGRI